MSASSKSSMQLEDCDCVTLDRSILARLAAEQFADRLPMPLAESHPSLFADVAVVVAEEHVAQMFGAIAAIERVVALPAYRSRVLADAPEIARFDPGNPGVFYGYDFHLTADGAKLIEVNTNAGGGMLNVLLARAQRPCETRLRDKVTGPLHAEKLATAFVDMFKSEWRSARGDAPLTCIAIVDEEPQRQYLYPEFVLFQRLFETHGIACIIADPRELVHRDGALYCGAQRIDFVYNRHTDFTLAAPHLAAIRNAYAERAVVVSPHPFGHALYADKRNMAIWSDADALRALGVESAAVATLLAAVPRTRFLTETNADALWGERRGLFFKPFAGFGGRAAYRGDKLTKRVWEEIRGGGYIAQQIAPPSERCVRVNDIDVVMKVDVRNFVYRGQVQWVSARIYQGQTTNFRTPGGGFAPVYSRAFAAA